MMKKYDIIKFIEIINCFKDNFDNMQNSETNELNSSELKMIEELMMRSKHLYNYANILVKLNHISKNKE